MSHLQNINTLKPSGDIEYFFDDITGDKWNVFKDSICNGGVLVPLIVTPDGKRILSGRQRYRACLELGIKKCPSSMRTLEIPIGMLNAGSSLNPISVSVGSSTARASSWVGSSRNANTLPVQMDDLPAGRQGWRRSSEGHTEASGRQRKSSELFQGARHHADGTAATGNRWHH